MTQPVFTPSTWTTAIEAIGKFVAAFHEQLREVTLSGADIDVHQVRVRALAALATRLEAARELTAYAARFDTSELRTSGLMTEVGVAVAHLLQHATTAAGSEPALDRELLAGLHKASDAASMIEAASAETIASLGKIVLDRGGAYNRPIPTTTGDDEAECELRESTRRFAQGEVAPLAERIHREDLLIPEDLVCQMSEMGYFGMSVPEEYGGIGLSNLMMVIATEELSAASLPAAGSLITRPEILAKALLAGGTENQKQTWLPRVASGELMVAVAVTEPDTGSDVASLSCRAVAANVDGQEGFLLNGAKAWCTFAGRANILALLARTEPDSALGRKGLSLFIVEKDPFDGHAFEMAQPGGGRITGKADATLGYRGMHSYTLQFENYFVPAENLIGEDAGRGKGFYLQMGGFAAGRLQTGGRAIGLAQAALEAAVKYAHDRSQFGSPIAEFQNTQYEIGWMASELEAARQLTYAAARAMDTDDLRANLLAAMAKRFACRMAVEVTQRAQVLHGGWGYAEEYPISRYVADALVLPIFEGVEPILDLKVIGRTLLAEPTL